MAPLLAIYPRLRLLDLRGVTPWTSEQEPPPHAYSRASIMALLPFMNHPGLCDLLLGCECPESSEGGSEEFMPSEPTPSAAPCVASWSLASGSDQDAVREAMAISAAPSVPPDLSAATRMQGYLAEAKLLLEARGSWQPVTDQGDIDWESLPAWRRPSSGGVHGSGPWLLLEEFSDTPDETG